MLWNNFQIIVLSSTNSTKSMEVMKCENKENVSVFTFATIFCRIFINTPIAPYLHVNTVFLYDFEAKRLL